MTARRRLRSGAGVLAVLVVIGTAAWAWVHVPELFEPLPLPVPEPDPEPAVRAAREVARATRESGISQAIVTTRASILAALAGLGALVTIGINYLNSRTHTATLRETRRSYKATEDDRAEQRVTELYTAAADQLGSDKAPVRLAGIYALERLARNDPGQRQTIVNVLCAYLRMPHDPPADPSADDSGMVARDEKALQEREVRLTAQQIIAGHLKPHGAGSMSTYWGALDLDLSGAWLVDLELSGCLVCNVRFRGARFSGDAGFRGARIIGDADFRGTEFSGRAGFEKVTISGDGDFRQAVFRGSARFSGATLNSAGFAGATFADFAFFRATTFNGPARFGQIPDIRNKGVVKGARFSRDTRFDKATFNGEVRFDGVHFGGDDQFGGVRAIGDAERVWPPGWVETGARGGDDAVELVRAAAPPAGGGPDPGPG